MIKSVNREEIEAKIAELTQELDNFVRQAERQIATYNGAIQGLEALLVEEEQTAEKPQKAAKEK